ncbi:MAG: AAA family ATPase [Candidatus Nitrosocaldus sp.]
MYKGIAKKRFTAQELYREIYKTTEIKSEKDYYKYIYSKLKSTLHNDVYEGLVTVFGDIHSIINVKSKRLGIKVSTEDIEYYIKVEDNSIRVELPPQDSFISSLERKSLKEFIKLLTRIEDSTGVGEDRINILDPRFILESFICSPILIPSRIYYMPAARSGLMQAHRMIAGTIIENASRLPISDIDIPRLTGVAADFIAQLISIPDIPIEISRRINILRHETFRHIIDFLDTQILEGSIDINVVDKEGVIAEFVYRDKKFDLTLPVVKAASGIAELAPLALYLKYVVIPNSILILEEPESHLHPELQRKVARLLAMLARAGVIVLITTHSDYLLHQINTLLLLSKLSGEDRKKFGYMENEFLNPNDVGAYLFKYDEEKKGYIIEELPTIDKESNEPGIPEDALTEVAFAMGKEVSKITYMLEERSNDG